MSGYRTPAQEALLYFSETLRSQAEIQPDRIEMFVNVSQNSDEIESGRLTCQANPKMRHTPRDWTQCVISIEGTEEYARPRMLLAIPAEVRPDSNGTYIFRPPTKAGIRRLPSIPVELLDQKRVDRTGFVLGPIEEADRWILQQGSSFAEAIRTADWSHWWRLSLGLAAAVMKSDSNVLGNFEEKLGPNSRISVKIFESAECPTLLRPFYKVLRTAAELKSMPPLLNAWVFETGSPVGIGGVRHQVDRAAKFTAVMDNYDAEGERHAFPLDPSQREALLYGLSSNQITSVQGPPGSGKTALLRAYTAAMMVNAILEDSPEPPFILATSATNLAVTNIIRDFADAAKPMPILPNGDRVGSVSLGLPSISSRWVPGAHSFGWFQPARSYLDRIRRAGGTQLEADGERGPVDMNSLPILDHCLSEAERLAGKRTVGDEGLAFRTDTFGTAAAVNGLFNGETVHERLLQGAAFWLKSYHEFAKQQRLPVSAKSTGTLREAMSDVRSGMAGLRKVLLENVAAQQKVNASFRRLMTEPRPAAAETLADALWSASYNHGLGFCDNLRLEAAMEKVQTEVAKMIASAAGLGTGSAVSSDARGKFGAAAQAVFDSVQAVLDLGPRAAAFHLAGRYWEGDFLATRIGKSLNPAAYARKLRLLAETKGPTAAIRESLREVLAIGPVVVSTVYALPSFFKFRNIPEAGFNAADVMIIDEASQCQPEIITPALAFAKKAFVVGDVKQLEPVSKLAPQHEKEIRESVIGSSPAAQIHADLLVTTGNAMLIAERAGGTRHLMLRGHYRCVPEIMSFFSKMCYGDKLVPMRKPRMDSENFHFAPPMGLYVADSETRKLKSGSMDNKTEARAIAEFLVRNADNIEALFGEPIEQCVGILTPYAAQRTVLASEIRRGFSARGKTLAANLDVDWLDAFKTAGEYGTFTKKFGPRPDVSRHMTLGTVHQFQGGQKKMIIISLTADGATKDTGPRFIDQSVNLLNVAVSRARESLLVFSAPGLITRDDTKGLSPSLALLKWMSRNGVLLQMPPPLEPPAVDARAIREREAGEFYRSERLSVDLDILLPSSESPEAASVATRMPEFVGVDRSTLSAMDALDEAFADLTGILLPQEKVHKAPPIHLLPKSIFTQGPSEDRGFHDEPPDIEIPPLSAYEEEIERNASGSHSDDDPEWLPRDDYSALAADISETDGGPSNFSDAMPELDGVIPDAAGDRLPPELRPPLPLSVEADEVENGPSISF